MSRLVSRWVGSCTNLREHARDRVLISRAELELERDPAREHALHPLVDLAWSGFGLGLGVGVGIGVRVRVRVRVRVGVGVGVRVRGRVRVRASERAES